MMRRSLALFLCLVTVLSMMPVSVLAREGCDHHTEHDAACGYVQAVEGVPCGHVCGEGCPTEAVTVCLHDHAASGCTYTEPKEAVYCGHACGDGSCAYQMAVPGAECTCGVQPHAEGCGYVEAQPEIPCDFIHNGCGCAEAVTGGWSCGHVCTRDSGCVKDVCSHVCTEDDCGFVASVNAVECSYSCPVCEVQALIDALPEEVTQENLEAVGAQLTAIDKARAKLTDAELAQVDFTRYQNAIAAINVLNGMPGAEEPSTLATSGSCGTSATWELSGTTLYIRGSGKMSNYTSSSPAPWREHKDTIKTISISSGITHIGNSAFDRFRAVTKVTIPGSVTSIGNFAFRECSISSVSLGSNMTSLGTQAFAGCANLTSVTLPPRVALGGYCFIDCTSLTKVTIPGGVTCPGAVSTDFSGCSGLTEVTIAEGATDVYPWMFFECFGLKKVNLPSTLKTIGEGAFSSCTSLEEVTVPASVTVVDWEAFGGCTSLKKITFTGNAPDINYQAFTDVVAYGYYPYGNTTWTSDKLVDYNGDITWNADGAPANPSGKCGDNAYWEFDPATGVLSITGSGDMYDYATLSAVPFDSYKTKITSVKVAEGIASIGDRAFQNAPVTSVALPSTLKDIGNQAFYGTKLTSVSIPNAVTAIGDGAFEGTSITGVKLPSSLKVIGASAFKDTPITSLTVPASVTNIGEAAFSSDESSTKLTAIVFEGAPPSIGAYTFAGVTATATCDAAKGWTSTHTLQYGGKLTWNVLNPCYKGHSYTYDKDTQSLGIRVGCSKCDLTGVFTLVLPTAPTYTGYPIEAAVTGTVEGLTAPAVTYSGPTTGGKPVEPGNYAASIALGNVCVSATFRVNGEYVAKTTANGITTSYDSLETAFAAANNAGSAQVVLLKDITGAPTGNADIQVTGNVTLDLGGKAVAGDVTVGSGAELTVTGSGSLDADVLVKGSLKVPAGTDYSRVFGEAGAKLTVGTQEMTWDAAANRWVCGSHKWVFGADNAQCSACGAKAAMNITAEEAVFSGQPMEPQVTVMLGSTQLTEGTDFTLSYDNNINAGTGAVTVTGIGSCSGTAETTFTIQPLAVQVAIASIPDQPYSGGAVTPGVELVLQEGYNGPVPQQGSDYTLTYTGNSGPGTASVTVSACDGGNFTFRSVAQTFVIRYGLELPGVTGTVYVDGVPKQVEDGILWLDEGGVKLITLCDYANAGAEDLHTVYPTAMYVYEVTGSEEQGYTVRRVTELDNILQYSGTSIRITGNQGIRFITSIPNAKKSALTGSGLAGYKLVEYGTLMGWYEEGRELLYGVNAKSVAYDKASGTDQVFNRTGDLCQFTGMLTDLELEQSTRDLMTRPYMVLERTDAAGQTEQVVLYGGSITRSIGYVAYQNKDVFKPGTSSYEFIWKILSYAYPDLYEAEYKG